MRLQKNLKTHIMKKLFILIAVIAGISNIYAQIQFEQILPPPPSPQIIANFEGVEYGSTSFADIDGDNDQDVLIIGMNNYEPKMAKLYVNDGSGNFSEVTDCSIKGGYRGSMAFADVDGDNDPDVLISGLNELNEKIAYLYINDGSGHFTKESNTPFNKVAYGSIAFADIDGDNDPDVLMTGENNSDNPIAKLYINDGNGHFSEVTDCPFPGVTYSSVTFADMDGDDDPDVLISGKNNSNQGISKLYMNDGSGHFSEATNTPFEGVYRGSVAFADMDGDNDPDLLITGYDNSKSPISKLYINNGNADFTELTDTPFEGVYSSSVALADMDGDHNTDVLIMGMNSSSEQTTKLYLNDGSTHFTEVPNTPFDGVYNGFIAIADVDGDDDPDVLITGTNYANKAIAIAYRNTTVNGIPDNQQSDKYIKLYPNPTTGKASLDLSQLKNVNLNIYNTLGVLVYTDSQIQTGIYNFDLKLENGVYIIDIRSDHHQFSVKMIKK